MQNFFTKFIEASKQIEARIIYDEITDNRIKDAVFMLRHQGFRPVLCNTKAVLESVFTKSLEKFEYIICPDDIEPTSYAAQMLAEGQVDWFISGALNTTGHTLKALIKNVWTNPWVKRVSWYFLMNTMRWLMLIADCAVQPNPTAEQLAEIAYLSAKSAKTFGIQPRIAMLSFSTKWSADHEMSQKVIEATALVKARFESEWITDVQIEWELQLDAAIDCDVASKKVKDWSWWGDANILIFPDLNSWNIGYKLMQYFGWAQAIWPIIQWFKKPWNDLSRGCSVDDIMILHSITVLQTGM